MMEIKVKKLKENAKLPQRATEGSAGYDLFACMEESVIIKPHGIAKIPTGIAVAIEDKNMALFIYARSGLASKYGIAPANCVGVVDSDYRGEIMVPLINLGNEYYTVEPGQRIAQMILAPVFLPDLIETDELPATGRGEGGFGSTGEK